MPGRLPDGDPAPEDGALPPDVVAGAAARRFGVYLHIPFCAVRCGYCDFNTYTASELGAADGLVGPSSFPDVAAAEVGLAGRVLAAAGLPQRPVQTVFLGGGTPSLLSVDGVTRLLDAVRATWGLAAEAEVSLEANPEVPEAALDGFAAAGVTRVSFGMQSAVPHVLQTLDRTHDPQRVPLVVRRARDAGMQVSLDLIYGTPGESAQDWRRSLDAALACSPDHLSAYALVVEPGTRLAVRVRRGEVAPVNDDVLAARYEAADDVLSGAGFTWYEVSNWARRPQAQCRHNLGYWRGDDWWGIGPGAHSHVGGVRWWNVRHPAEYARRLAVGQSPAAGREVLDDGACRLERVMLGIRLAEGLDATELDGATRDALPDLAAEGLVEAAAVDRVVLTRRGRLLADAVVRALTP
jgi:oxygen-independent coproporphyrinogen-3 oxidase